MKITKMQLKKIVNEAMRYDYGSQKGDVTVRTHKNSAELQALAFVFTMQVLPDDVSYIIYQPRKRGGTVTRLDLEDRDQQLGHIAASVNAEEAAKFGTTVQRIQDFLSSNGAELRTRSPKRYKYPPPMYD